MAGCKDHITVCVCTYLRPELLTRLLTELAHQKTDGLFTFSCVVVDNDPGESARPVVVAAAERLPLILRYMSEATKNFAVIRNRALDLVDGNLFAIIDDDEVPGEEWLMRLRQTLYECSADGVLGPVRPYFAEDPPSWIVKSRICWRPEYPTGTVLHWKETRTGNVLMRTSLVTETGLRFDPQFGTGGEDVDFFRRASAAGKRFVWCSQAPAFELVPAARLRRRYYIKRALVQGGISLKYAVARPSAGNRLRVAGRASCAAALYTLALPVLFIAGDHVGMKYLIKDCHHIARLLAIVGISRSHGRGF
jgi:glycosyltransferase involved in cell wall biosynthesis